MIYSAISAIAHVRSLDQNALRQKSWTLSPSACRCSYAARIVAAKGIFVIGLCLNIKYVHTEYIIVTEYRAYAVICVRNVPVGTSLMEAAVTATPSKRKR